MGVPKFFRWISERYPCLSELVREYQIPEFDNLYLDMNGIIHMCSHPNDADPHFRITEEKIFKDIFHYIEILFRMIQPQKLFFMAVDGVAPRAKMNQQRGRRFRSAKEAELLEQKARERGEVLPIEERFDSNCITPGTVFMARLHEQLKYFVTYKVSTDPLWQKVSVILSGHETPGEGEHKIMEYIRYLKAQPNYNPNTRHCLYGLDADLIMLGLCAHEPHFSLLREEVKFGRKQKHTSTPEETTFFLLHLSLMREYLELEFGVLKTTLSFPFDIEKIIDDWVLMGFLVGNDFIPPLPDMHIINGALPTLYQAYIEVLPTLGGYINEGGNLNLKRFQKYMEKLSAFDFAQFRDTYADLKYFEGKRGGRRMGDKERPSYKNKDSSFENGKIDFSAEEKSTANPELAALIKSTDDILLDVTSSGDEEEDEEEEDCFDFDDIDYDNDESEEANALFLSEFSQHKKHYYMDKLEYSTVTSEVLRSQAECYVRAIQWNLNYYYNGVCSWSWYYPHHYAPYISDVRNFSDLKIEFELGEPFLPFQQLLAVLPALSKKLLPEPYQKLMVDKDSPIIHYYPSTFKTDLNGKKQEWEAVVLIPFIEEKYLLEAMEPCNKLLTPEEQKRNSHGPMLVYHYTAEDLGHYECPQYFPPLPNHHAKVKLVWRQDVYIEPSKLVKVLSPGVSLDVFYPGFPTLKHIPHKASIQKMKVKVFEMPSRGENMILEIQDQGKPNLKEVAEELLGKSIYVEWPHLKEAKVIAVSNREFRYTVANDTEATDNGTSTKFTIEEVKGNCASLWNSQRKTIQEHYMNRLGVDIGTTTILLYAAQLIGRKYIFEPYSKITLEKQWNNVPSPYALQTTVKDIAVQDSSFVHYKKLHDIFPAKSICFLLAHPHYGSVAEVMDANSGYVRSGRVRVDVIVTQEPSLEEVCKQQMDMFVHYMPGAVAAQRLGISTHLVSRLTGTIYIVLNEKSENSENNNKVNVGLNLKFNKRNEEIPGYSRKENSVWYYSVKAVELVADYMKAFPELFDYLSYHTGNDVFYKCDVFPGPDGTDKVTAICNWLREQPYYKVERQPCGSEVLEEEVVQQIEKTVDCFLQGSSILKSVTMQVKPYLLYKSSLHIGSLPPDPTTTNRLFDRVVNVRESFTVPLGYKGTIIGIHKAEKEEEYMYDIVFDKPFAGGLPINCSSNRGYRVPRATFINLSHGQRMEPLRNVSKPTAIVQPSGGCAMQELPAFLANSSRKIQQQQQQNQQLQSQQQQSQQQQQSHQQQQHAPLINNLPTMSSPHNSAFASWSNQSNLRSNNANLFAPSFSVSPLAALRTPQLYHPGMNLPSPGMPVSQGPPLLPFTGGNSLHPPHLPLQQQPQQHYRDQRQQLYSKQSPVSNKKNKATQQSQPEQTFQLKGQNTTPVKSSGSPTEFQAIWNELQKAAVGVSSPVTRKSKTFSNPTPPTAQSRQEIADSGTELLKKMLRISDEPVNTPKKSPLHLQNVKQFSIQDLFEPRTPEVKNATHCELSYCQQLLAVFQQKGLGVPRYKYLQHQEDNSVIVHVLLPDNKVFVRDKAPTKEQASENAAKTALMRLSTTLLPVYTGNVMAKHPVSTDGMKPMTNNLPTPPQQWYQQNWPQNQPQPNCFQPSRQGYQQGVPGGEFLMDWRYGNDNSNRSFNRQSSSRPAQSMQSQQQYLSHFTVQPQFQQCWQNQRNRRQPNEDPKSNSQFVPLQAVKQQRSKSSSHHAVLPKASDNIQGGSVIKEANTGASTASALTSSNTVPSACEASPHVTDVAESHTPMKPTALRPRKSRIAANFSNFSKE